MSEVIRAGPDQLGPTGMVVQNFPLEPGFWFALHVHAHPQILWTPHGVVAVAADEQRWVLPPPRALWVPAGVAHRTGSSRGAQLHSVYLHTADCPQDWTRPTMLAVRPLLAELVRYLSTDEPADAQRGRAERLLLDLLDPLPSGPLEVRMPADPRAAKVASALRDNPADDRSLNAFALFADTSPRTLSRLFVAETGLSFERWRTGLRMWVALPLLADHESVARVARRVGYATPSAFLAAFRRTVGMPPGAYLSGLERTRLVVHGRSGGRT